MLNIFLLSWSGRQVRTDWTHQRERRRSRPRPSTTPSSTRCLTRQGRNRSLQRPDQRLLLDPGRPQCLDQLRLAPPPPFQEPTGGSDSGDLESGDTIITDTLQSGFSILGVYTKSTLTWAWCVAEGDTLCTLSGDISSVAQLASPIKLN